MLNWCCSSSFPFCCLFHSSRANFQIPEQPVTRFDDKSVAMLWLRWLLSAWRPKTVWWVAALMSLKRYREISQYHSISLSNILLNVPTVAYCSHYSAKVPTRPGRGNAKALAVELVDLTAKCRATPNAKMTSFHRAIGRIEQVEKGLGGKGLASENLKTLKVKDAKKQLRGCWKMEQKHYCRWWDTRTIPHLIF